MLQTSDLNVLQPESIRHIASPEELTVGGPESSFQIHGSGLNVRDGSPDEVFESTFQIADDSGTGKYFGLEGCGNMNIRAYPIMSMIRVSQRRMLYLTALDRKQKRGVAFVLSS
jgi:hypothetical protein